MSDQRAFTRRLFLQRGLAMVSTVPTLPLFLQSSALAIDNPFDYRAGKAGDGDGDRILVIVQLGGGNDGLNTLVPYGDRAYYEARPQLAIAEADLHKFDRRDADGIGLHPALTGLRELYDQGLLGMCQGVGYPNPNRSHFKSMDIWHTANPQTDGQGAGWVGRYFDNACKGEPEPNLCVSIGQDAPLAVQGSRKVSPIAFEDERLFRWAGEDLHEDMGAAYQTINRKSPTDAFDSASAASFVMRTALDAQIASDRIRAAARSEPAVSYPSTRLGRSLKLIGQMIGSGLGTRVYYADMGGFDTHAGQAGRHAALLRQFADAMRAFARDLKAQGNADRVLTMTFSEFGRRVKQNASGGTDHGTAAPMFLMGPMVRPGVHGRQPSLRELDGNGDLVYNVDFREVYTTVLENWLGVEGRAVLGRRFKAAPLLAPKLARVRNPRSG